jgi:hypothetical protein
MTQVVIDRTVCTGPLSKSGFIAGKPDGFGIFERWILRLGCFTRRASGQDVFGGDLAVFLNPSLPVSADFRDALAGYVRDGGKVLVLDGPENAESSANSLLWPFGLSVRHDRPVKGAAMTGPASWPRPAVASACEVVGGTPLARMGGKCVAATARHGEGTVTVVAFSERFTDARMGVTGNVIPDAALRAVYELQFALVRSIIQDGPTSRPTTAPN